MRFARESERAQHCGDGRPGSTLAGLERIAGLQSPRVDGHERQHSTNLDRCGRRFEKGRKLARGFEPKLERGKCLASRPPRSQIFEA